MTPSTSGSPAAMRDGVGADLVLDGPRLPAAAAASSPKVAGRVMRASVRRARAFDGAFPLTLRPIVDLDRAGAWGDPDDGDLAEAFRRPGVRRPGWATVRVPHHWRSVPSSRPIRRAGPVPPAPTIRSPPPDAGARSSSSTASSTTATSWLDGDYLGATEGYFVPHVRSDRGARRATTTSSRSRSRARRPATAPPSERSPASSALGRGRSDRSTPAVRGVRCARGDRPGAHRRLRVAVRRGDRGAQPAHLRL